VTVWYAQANAAIQTAANWHDAAGGGNALPSWPPAADDVLCANGKAITWAAASVPSLTCARLTTAAEGGTAGGGFTLSGSAAVAITADITAGTTTCLTSTHTGTGANGVTVLGDLTCGGTASAHCWLQTGTGDLTVGSALSPVTVTGGSNNNQVLRCISTGTITIYGDCIGGTHGQSRCVYANGNIIVLYGNVTAVSAGIPVEVRVGRITINGTCTGGGSAPALLHFTDAGNQITVNGDVLAGGSAGAYGIRNDSVNGSVTVVGSLIDTEQCGATAGKIYWQPVAGVHYHKVFYSAGTPKYYTHPPAQTDVRDGIFAGFSESGVAYNGNVVLPSAGDVRLGVDYDYPGKETGTLHLPAEADVKTGVGYGTNGTEFEGELVAGGGGGVPLIGPGGLVG